MAIENLKLVQECSPEYLHMDSKIEIKQRNRRTQAENGKN